jgi:hypothetical protein
MTPNQQLITAAHENISLGLMRQAEGIAAVKTAFDHASTSTPSSLKEARAKARELMRIGTAHLDTGLDQLLGIE